MWCKFGCGEMTKKWRITSKDNKTYEKYECEKCSYCYVEEIVKEQKVIPNNEAMLMMRQSSSQVLNNRIKQEEVEVSWTEWR